MGICARDPTRDRRAPGPFRPIEVAFCALLVAATVAAYGNVLDSGFVRLDDYGHLLNNPVVRNGVTQGGAWTALTSVLASNWYPLTWYSHMLDFELFGLAAGAHHAVNLLLHIVDSLLLFGVLRSATGASARSAVVAALFALHPTHVESVAWVSERKDVLSALFGLLCLGAYVRYTRENARRWMATCAAMLILGLLAKPILVTLPVLLLLLDYWPLGRLRDAGHAAPLIREKLPLFCIVLVFAGLTLFVQQSGGALRSGAELSLPLRLGNAIVSCWLYVASTVWPTNLSVLYPHPNLPGGTPWSVWQVSGAFAALAASSALFLRRGEYASTGWLWFLVCLAPVIGLIQAGDQGMADRYLYLAGIGLYVIATWGGFEVMTKLAGASVGGRLAMATAATALIACAVLTTAQVAHWRDSIALFTHSLRVAPGSYTLHNNLGNAFHDEGRVDDAIEQYRRAVAIHPGYLPAHRNLARALDRRGDPVAAAEHRLRGRQIDLESAAAQLLLGGAHFRAGDVAQADARFARARALAPGDPDPHLTLGRQFLQGREPAKAIVHLREAVRREPASAEAALLLGAALQERDLLEEAILHFERATRLDDGSAVAHAALAQALAAAGDVQRAKVSASRAREIDADSPAVRALLGPRSL